MDEYGKDKPRFPPHPEFVSPATGPDPESSLSESVRSQMVLTPPPNGTQSNQSAEWEEVEEGLSDESEEHLVQSDEADVPPDASPTGRHDAAVEGL